MGTTFTHFNPASDENGMDLQTRFTSKIKNITEQTEDVYCIIVSDDKCHKYKVNNKSAPVEMKDYTPQKLFRFIFGYVFKHYIESPEYKNMSEEDLEQIGSDFIQHLKNTKKVILQDAKDIELGRFSVKFPNNAFAKYADHSKVFFSRILNEQTRETEYFYFPILLEENKKKYHVILKYQEMRTIGIKTFNPFDDIMDDMSEFAKAILTDLKNSCILHIREERILIEFIEDEQLFAYEQTSKEFYKMVLCKMYEDFAHETLTDDELTQSSTDFEVYIKTTVIEEGDDINADKYAFHTLFPNNAFSKGIISKGQKTKYMCKIMDPTNKQHVKYHYLPLAVVSNDKTYNALIATTF
jgi:hypothetical protein